MPVTRNQASSTNEGDEDTLQRLLRAVASLQAHNDKQSRLSREEELQQQLEALKAAGMREPAVATEAPAQPFWGQPFSREIDETLIPPNFKEIVVEPFDGI
ncbi:hypothetical protein CR513_09689, partial [Mucuna pruriens]